VRLVDATRTYACQLRVWPSREVAMRRIEAAVNDRHREARARRRYICGTNCVQVPSVDRLRERIRIFQGFVHSIRLDKAQQTEPTEVHDQRGGIPRSNRPDLRTTRHSRRAKLAQHAVRARVAPHREKQLLVPENHVKEHATSRDRRRRKDMPRATLLTRRRRLSRRRNQVRGSVRRRRSAHERNHDHRGHDESTRHEPRAVAESRPNADQGHRNHLRVLIPS
jgi:hypothetical protein